jgi:putative N-acetyltransferase (TIGR04045 family)
MSGARVPGTFISPAVLVREAAMEWEYAACHALRRQVFCVEQGIFPLTDRDAIDDVASVLAAVSTVAGMDDDIVGTVRIHEQRPRVWVGSRLAVAGAHRNGGGIGTTLIRLAVCLAHARGARRFLAHVQSRNAALFHALNWHTIAEEELHGHPHHVMEADLACYPAAGARALHVLRTAA